jgi:putative addiction module component (TIGR02574 family)
MSAATTSLTADQLFAAVLALPRDKRMQLAIILEDSLENSESSAEVAAAWDVEIKRRIEAANRGEGHWLTEEEVNQRLDAKYGPLQD